VTNREIAWALRCCAKRDCARCPTAPEKAGCIYELKMAAAEAIEKLLHVVFKAELKDRLCQFNSVVICDWPEDRPGRCKTCPCNPERIDRTEWECEA
jgi:hypothetical protein